MHKYRLIWTYRERLRVESEFEAASNIEAVKIGKRKYQTLENLTLHGTYKVQWLLIGTQSTWITLDANTGEKIDQ